LLNGSLRQERQGRQDRQEEEFNGKFVGALGSLAFLAQKKRTNSLNTIK
jgi:hypothetical protein